MCRGYIYIFHNIVFILFALMSSTRQISPSHFLIHYFSIIQITSSQFLPFPLNPSKSPLFLHFHYFSPISSKKHYVVSGVVQLPYLSHFLQLHPTQNDPIFYFFTPNTPLNPS